MPLIRVDLLASQWQDAEIKTLLELIHEALVKSWNIPIRDKYQIVNQHNDDDLILLDTGLGIQRSKKSIILSITSIKRTEKQKQEFYQELANSINQDLLDLSSKDLVINITDNSQEDWSFGYGEAQFITKKL